MTPEEVEALGVSTDLQTAALALNVSKSHAYNAIKAGTFPCGYVRIGSRIVVRVHGPDGLKAALGLGPP